MLLILSFARDKGISGKSLSSVRLKGSSTIIVLKGLASKGDKGARYKGIIALSASGEGYVLVNFVWAILTSIDYKQELNILRSSVKSFISLLL